jgi:hypothetical protein
MCVVFEVPHDVITQQVQIQKASTSSWTAPSPGWALAQHIWRTEGVRGLYSGVGAHLLTFLPWSMTWWASYELGKVVLGRWMEYAHVCLIKS